MAKKHKTTYDYFAEIIAQKAPKYRDDFKFLPVTKEHIQRAARVAALVDKFFAPIYGYVGRHGESYLRFHDWETLEIGIFGNDENVYHPHYRIRLLRDIVEIPNGASGISIFHRAVGMLAVHAAFEWAHFYDNIGDVPIKALKSYANLLSVKTSDDAREALKYYVAEALHEKREEAFFSLFVRKAVWIAAVYGFFVDDDELLAPIVLNRE